MAQADFDLLRFHATYHVACRLLEDSDLDQDERNKLQEWWNKRLRRLSQQVRVQRLNAQTERERFFLLLALAILQPNDSSVLGELNDAGLGYTMEINRRIEEERQNITGETRLLAVNRQAEKERQNINGDTPAPLRILEDQIKNLDALIREIRAAVNVWKDVTGRASNLNVDSYPNSQWIESLRANLSTSSSSKSHSSKGQSLLMLQEDLTRLRTVVFFIHEQLHAAYRENIQSLWQDFDQKLVGYRDIQSQEKWVAQGLQTHVSYRWISETIKDLKFQRQKLSEKTQEIEICLKYHGLEGEEKLDDDSLRRLTSTRDSLSETEKNAQDFIITERKKPLLMQQSVFEKAYRDLLDVIGMATVEKYRSYTEGVNSFLIEELTQKLRNTHLLPQNQSLRDYLSAQIQLIEDLRKCLKPFIGQNGEQNNELLNVYKEVYSEVVILVRSAHFEEANQFCEKTEKRLDEAIQCLQTCKDLKTSTVQNPSEPLSSTPGMAKRLQSQVEQTIAQLQTEKEQIIKLRGCIKAHKETYEQYRERFYRRSRELTRSTESIFRFLKRKRIKRLKEETISCLCQCYQLCPKAEEWNRFQDDLKSCQAPSEKEWASKFFSEVPLP